MNSSKIFFTVVILLILGMSAQADIPNLINFQGILDSAGNPLANKTKSVEFKIYAVPAGGTAYWSETQSVTTNAGGVFNVLLGFSNPIPDSVFDDTIRYLGIKVETDAEMAPRQQIVSVAYSYVADMATPIAYAFINSDGSVASGTSNVTSSWNAGNQRYEITITGESYSATSYVTVVTPRVGGTPEALFATTNSSGGQLLIRIMSSSTGTTGLQKDFQFITYKP